jgi:rhodanese-related sulfurtransferase
MVEIKRISPNEAKELIDRDGYTYVDVRSEPEFEAGHPAGAINVPIHAPDFLEVMKGTFQADSKIILGCQVGARSFRAAQMLIAAGFTNIIDQRAGFAGARSPFGGMAEPGWAPAGLPVESGAPAGRSFPDVRAKAGR